MKNISRQTNIMTLNKSCENLHMRLVLVDKSDLVFIFSPFV